MAEFKRLSEVELTENISDTSTILIEENGDIKRAPKSKVGGGAEGLIVTFTDEYLDYFYNYSMFIISENYDNIYDTLCKGGQVWVDCSILNENSVTPSVLSSSGSGSGGGSDINTYPSAYGQMVYAIVGWMLTDIGLMCDIMFHGDLYGVLFPNGSHNIEVEEPMPS